MDCFSEENPYHHGQNRPLFIQHLPNPRPLMAFHLAHIQEYHRFIALEIGSYRIRTGIYNIENGEIIRLGISTVRQSRRDIQNGQIVDMR